MFYSYMCYGWVLCLHVYKSSTCMQCPLELQRVINSHVRVGTQTQVL